MRDETQTLCKVTRYVWWQMVFTMFTILLAPMVYLILFKGYPKSCILYMSVQQWKGWNLNFPFHEIYSTGHRSVLFFARSYYIITAACSYSRHIQCPCYEKCDAGWCREFKVSNYTPCHNHMLFSMFFLPIAPPYFHWNISWMSSGICFWYCSFCAGLMLLETAGPPSCWEAQAEHRTPWAQGRSSICSVNLEIFKQTVKEVLYR